VSLLVYPDPLVVVAEAQVVAVHERVFTVPSGRRMKRYIG
jgi:hypothetical protein